MNDSNQKEKNILYRMLIDIDKKNRINEEYYTIYRFNRVKRKKGILILISY